MDRSRSSLITPYRSFRQGLDALIAAGAIPAPDPLQITIAIIDRLAIYPVGGHAGFQHVAAIQEGRFVELLLIERALDVVLLQR